MLEDVNRLHVRLCGSVGISSADTLLSCPNDLALVTDTGGQCQDAIEEV